MIYDKHLSELAFNIGAVYDDYSVEKKEKIAKMILCWKEKEKWTSGFEQVQSDMKKRVQFDLESD